MPQDLVPTVAAPPRALRPLPRRRGGAGPPPGKEGGCRIVEHPYATPDTDLTHRILIIALVGVIALVCAVGRRASRDGDRLRAPT
jgi:hypothetical protein